MRFKKQKKSMISKKFLTEKLKKILKKEFKRSINEKNKIYDFLEWDSVGNFNLLLACEKEFNIKFNSNEFNKINSFKEIIKIVQKKS